MSRHPLDQGHAADSAERPKRFPGVGTHDALGAALDHGVAYVPADAFTIDEARPETARLSFATVDPEDFASATERLAAAFAS